MAKKDLDGIDLILLILFLPFVIGYFLIVGIVKLIEKVNENTENYTRNGSGRRDFILEEGKWQRKEERRLNKIRKQYAKEREKLEKVATLGKLGKALSLINQELKFLKVVQEEVVEIETLDEYKLFSPKEYFSARYLEVCDLFSNLRNNVQQNNAIYDQYKRSFFDCKDFTPNEEIKAIRGRGMSVKKFRELEKKLHNTKLQNPPKNKMVFVIRLKYKENKKTIEMEESEAWRLLQEIRFEREHNFVCKHSNMYKALSELNKKSAFFDIKVPSFNVKCSSYNEYQKFNVKDFVRKRVLMNADGLELLYNQTVANKTMYNDYQQQYVNIAQYLRTTEDILMIKDSPLSVDKFKIIEKAIYSQIKLNPIVDFSISYKVDYTSPAGRNSYTKKEYLTKQDIEDVLRGIAQEKEAKQELERQKEILKNQRLREKSELRNILKNKEKLEQKEAELTKREQEFQRATQGHIYAVSDSPTSIEAETPKTEIVEESLSAWEKMKRLKRAYENGEVTYEEYNEKRKHLL